MSGRAQAVDTGGAGRGDAVFAGGCGRHNGKGARMRKPFRQADVFGGRGMVAG